ncbi:hypothetical protein U6G28_02490 [Actinomycetaceae bacterium MB13-C1-2]|nr:hypothetical protein U6G28_02490 [Actinomycetaceae bacterium MB13-C1-2]
MAALFAKIDLDLPDHPKVMPLSDAAFRAYVESILWSRKHLTDGFLASRYVSARWSLEVARELVGSDDEKPLWMEVDGGYQIHDFEGHNDTKAQVEARQEHAKRAGQAGGLAKAKRSAKRSSSKVLSKNVPETETETHILTRDFDAWYSLYPKKVGKGDALKAFKSARKKVSQEELVRGVGAYARSVAHTDRQYIKGPAAWLRAESWSDELTPSSPRPTIRREAAPPEVGSPQWKAIYGEQ